MESSRYRRGVTSICTRIMTGKLINDVITVHSPFFNSKQVVCQLALYEDQSLVCKIHCRSSKKNRLSTLYCDNYPMRNAILVEFIQRMEK